MDAKKTIMPEVLPDPERRLALVEGNPRERTSKHLKRLVDAAKLTAAAGMVAHCTGYGVVDPLPPPPIQCTSNSDPFADLVVSGIAVPSDGGWSNALIMLSSYRTVGYQFNAVRVTAGGTLVAAEDMSQSGAGGGTNFDITIHPDGSGAPLEFEVDLGCGSATATRHYRASFNGTGYTVVDLG